ncbi:unnamed protein product [Peniophora sp. CBMAI 1063]|nr:unnamed protein product [Peniophora sp. CBMAI 1063]
MVNRAGDGDIGSWQAIITLLVFIATIAALVFPVDIPVIVPRFVVQHVDRALVWARIRPPSASTTTAVAQSARLSKRHPHRFLLPINFVTAPLIAVLLLLAIGTIGRQEVHDGTLGADNIVPIDIMAFFLGLAYVAISIDASGLIRFLAFVVVKKGGNVGHRLYFYLYVFFFALGTFVGNDPIILSGTAFLAYLTRVAANIKHPRAWIYSQFAVANISSAILVSSNPTNLVLAGAFQITFTNYTANMIVPVAITGLALFPFLLYLIFPSEDLIPLRIEIRDLPDAEAAAGLTDSPAAMDSALETEEPELDKEAKEAKEREELPLEELLNPFLDKEGAIFGGVIITITLATILATNAAHAGAQVYQITTPAAVITLCRDIFYDWRKRNDRPPPDEELDPAGGGNGAQPSVLFGQPHPASRQTDWPTTSKHTSELESAMTPTQPEAAFTKDRYHSPLPGVDGAPQPAGTSSARSVAIERSGSVALRQGDSALPEIPPLSADLQLQTLSDPPTQSPVFPPSGHSSKTLASGTSIAKPDPARVPRTLVDIARDTKEYIVKTFPTVYTVMQHLPFPLVPFAFCMFTLVQGLVTKGWVELFAGWWHAWVNKTGVVGAIGGMGFLSVVMCNFSGTNIGATILISRVLQEWMRSNPMSDRLRDATLYALAIGVNYGAFSFTFSASLAGLLWRDILARKFIYVRRLDFARINLPIISIAMAIGCGVLTAQVYIVKDGSNSVTAVRA